MSANKESLLIKFKNQIDENIKKGAKTSKDLRIGIPSKFIASDGKEYRLQNVGRYFRTGKNPTFLDVALNKEVSAARANALKIQTSPDVEKWNPKTDAVKGTEAHHKRMVKMYAPFYEGLNEKQARKLTKWFVDEGVPLGDAKSNLKNLSPKVHKEIHKWMIDNNIQVRPDKTGKGNFVTLDKGPYKGTKFVKGSVDGDVKAVMPSFKNIPLNARYPLIANWLKYVQDPVDQKLSELEWDDYRAKNKPKPTDALQIEAIAKELAEEKSKSGNPFLEATDEYGYKSNGDNGGKTNGVNSGNAKKVGLNIGKGTGTRRTDNAINFGVALGTGNYGGAAVSAGSIGAGEALKSKAAQKFIAEQMLKIGTKRGGNMALKLIPGVDIGISAKEAWDYLRTGKLDQAALATLSGAVGWVPLFGDGLSAGIDLTNTGIDVARLYANTNGKNKKKLETDTSIKSPTRKVKIKL